MRIGVLGLGEAGALYAQALAASGSPVAGYDPAATQTPAGVRRAASVADAVAGAELVIGLTGAASAVAAAEEAAPALAAHACYADFTSAAPETKREIARTVRVAMADVAVLAPVPRQGAATPLLVSGPGAGRVAEVFLALGAEVEVLEAPAGAAAERKLLRSVFMKGLAATVLEAVTAGEAAGCEQWVRDQIARELGGHALVDRLITGTTAHAARRRHEMTAARDHLAALGTPTAISDATLAWLTRLDRP